jgi:hypothetical protein
VLVRQGIVGGGEVGQRAGATQHEVGDRARHEGLARLDQQHVDALLGEQAHVLGRGGATVAAADHHHLGARGHAAARGTAAERREHAAGCRRADQLTSLHFRFPPIHLRAAK